MQFHETFRAMNTGIDVILERPVAEPGLILTVKLLFDQQEARFSRFREDSLLSRLNRDGVVEDGWLADACRLALEAHAFTDGLFNPMVLPALREAGYSTSFEHRSGGMPRQQEVPDVRECLRIDGDIVRLQHGNIDLGGIVKGWTADLAVATLAPECPDMLVNAGGDMRCSGTDGGGAGWAVTIEEPLGNREIWAGRLNGAMATSTTLKRRWTTIEGMQAHHLIDPRTGLPADSPFVQVTAWAPEAWRAESWAKAVLIGGESAVRRAVTAGISVVTLDHDARQNIAMP